jgi:hypothetical protein
MRKEKYQLSSQYMKDLKKLLKTREATPYDIAHASFRKNNADLIIKNYNKTNLIIKYLDGTSQKFQTYSEFMKMIKNLDDLYPINRKYYIKRYFKVLHKFKKHRKKLRERSKNKVKETKNTIANVLCPNQVRILASQI